MNTQDFYVIAICTNPVRYGTRWKLFQDFQAHMTDIGANLITVEMAYGDRPFAVTEKDNPWHLQFRSDQELWHKENLINLGIEYLSQFKPDWKYVAWIDGDVTFQRRDVIVETIHQLQHYDVVQMFSHAVDLGPNGEFVKQDVGFMYQYHQNGLEAPSTAKGYGGTTSPSKAFFWHPGYAWAARRSALNKLKLLDTAILGAADHHMAMALVGKAQLSVARAVSPGYKAAVLNWQRVAEYALRRNVGYVPGMITHGWHGPKKNRKYVERWDVLIDTQYDPSLHITRDEQGVIRLNDFMDHESIVLRDKLRSYFRQRDEDSKAMD